MYFLKNCSSARLWVVKLLEPLQKFTSFSPHNSRYAPLGYRRSVQGSTGIPRKSRSWSKSGIFWSPGPGQNREILPGSYREFWNKFQQVWPKFQRRFWDVRKKKLDVSIPTKFIMIRCNRHEYFQRIFREFVCYIKYKETFLESLYNIVKFKLYGSMCPARRNTANILTGLCNHCHKCTVKCNCWYY